MCPGTPGTPVRFPAALPALCSLKVQSVFVKERRLDRDKYGRLRPGAGLTEGVEGASVHGGSIFGVKEEGGDLSAGQQVGVTLRQCEPLQLMSQ